VSVRVDNRSTPSDAASIATERDRPAEIAGGTGVADATPDVSARGTCRECGATPRVHGTALCGACYPAAISRVRAALSSGRPKGERPSPSIAGTQGAKAKPSRTADEVREQARAEAEQRAAASAEKIVADVVAAGRPVPKPEVSEIVPVATNRAIQVAVASGRIRGGWRGYEAVA
jgi:hypothetical protein